MEAAAEEPAATAPASLFPVTLRPTSDGDAITTAHPRQWLCNQSFTTDLSVIEDAVKHTNPAVESQSEEEEEGIKIEDEYTRPQLHALVESSSHGERRREKKKKEKGKKRKKSYSSSSSRSAYNFDATSRKPNVSSWDSSSSDAAKSTARKYYFDSRGDRDNLAFGCVYRYLLAYLLPHFTCLIGNT